jgi:hypothetical protein
MFGAISVNTSSSTNTDLDAIVMAQFGPGPLQYLNRLLTGVIDNEVAERIVSSCEDSLLRGGTPQQAEAFIRVFLHLPMA